MQLKVEANIRQPWAYTLAALASLELLNLLLWMVLNHGSKLLVGSGLLTGADSSVMIIMGTYPILLLSPLLTKWLFNGCSLLPLYVVNLAQMAVITWGVVH